MGAVELLISFVSISLLALLAAKMFPAKDILNAETATADYQRFSPGARIDTAILGLDHQTALLALKAPADQLGIVTRLGDRLVCRTAHKGDVASFNVNGDKLSIASHDFTQPTVSIKLSSDMMGAVQQLITDFTAEAGGNNGN